MSNLTGAQLQRGVIVEFDFAVLPGHRLLLDTCSARLAKEGVKLDATLMARFMIGKSFSSGLNALCTKQQKTIDIPAVIAECNEQFAAALKASLSEVPAGFLAFVSAALSKGLKVVLVSRVESDAVRALFQVSATDKLVVVHETPNSFGFCSWDGWRRACRKNELHEQLCVAVAGCGVSVKGSLTSGLSVMVKENPLTNYQDVGGCDVRIGEFSAALADDAVRILRI